MSATTMIYVNILIGGVGTTIYLLWAGKWLQRRAYALFIANLLSAAVLSAFVLGYAFIALDPDLILRVHPVFRVLFPFLIGGPVLARVLEYRQDQIREEYHRVLAQKLMGDADGMA